MCDTCAKHWQEVDLESGELLPGKKEPPAPILEQGCDDCKRFFGWVIHREYKSLAVLAEYGATLGPFYVVNITTDGDFIRLGRSPSGEEACEMVGHIRAT